MFETKFRKQGILNPDIGMEYRYVINSGYYVKDTSFSIRPMTQLQDKFIQKYG